MRKNLCSLWIIFERRFFRQYDPFESRINGPDAERNRFFPIALEFKIGNTPYMLFELGLGILLGGSSFGLFWTTLLNVESTPGRQTVDTQAPTDPLRRRVLNKPNARKIAWTRMWKKATSKNTV